MARFMILTLAVLAVLATAQRKCKKNEIFTECSTICPAKCGEYEPRACIMMCGPAKCQCAGGFYLNNKGECVTRAECGDAARIRRSTPKISCANIRCIGRCVDTPNGPNCSGPRPQVLPSWAKDT